MSCSCLICRWCTIMKLVLPVVCKNCNCYIHFMLKGKLIPKPVNVLERSDFSCEAVQNENIHTELFSRSCNKVHHASSPVSTSLDAFKHTSEWSNDLYNHRYNFLYRWYNNETIVVIQCSGNSILVRYIAINIHLDVN